MVRRLRWGEGEEPRIASFKLSTMLGDRDRGWCVVWAQSYVPGRVGTRSTGA
jgi:hypothetical protein